MIISLTERISEIRNKLALNYQNITFLMTG